MKNSTRRSTMISRIAVIIAKRLFPTLIQQCPYKKNFTFVMVNKTLEYKLLSILPLAVYKVYVRLHFENGESLLNVTLIGEIF